MSSLVPNKGDILYFYIFGDQHHRTSEAARQGQRVISDGGSNIHTNFLLRIPGERSITLFTYQDNYQVRNFFGGHKNITIREFKTISGLFKKYLLWIEVLTRCLYPGPLFLFKKMDYRHVVTQTDFLPDTWAAFLLKLRNPRVEWIASFFLKAPAPWQKDSPYKGKRWIIGLFYWLQQLPSIWFIKWKADKVMVTSEPDVKRFLNKKRDHSKIIVVQGGVNIEASESYLNSGSVTPVAGRKYDACFSGRFHYQKGVLELINIWREVCLKKKEAKLVMIGNGELEKDVQQKIKDYHLENNIDVVGFKGGEDKYDLFKQSKIMVHPATYDSGGMAAAEGLAWGLPGVSFDLPALRTYYPKGMIKTPLGDLRQFADNILRLLNDETLYRKTAGEAHDLIVTVWDWDKRAKMMVDKLFNDSSCQKR